MAAFRPEDARQWPDKVVCLASLAVSGFDKICKSVNLIVESLGRRLNEARLETSSTNQICSRGSRVATNRKLRRATASIEECFATSTQMSSP